MFAGKIKTNKDVEHFFDYLVKTLHLNFHPDTNFSDYVNFENGVSFSPQNAENLNLVMLSCFELCQVAGIDIYELGIISLKKRVA